MYLYIIFVAKRNLSRFTLRKRFRFNSHVSFKVTSLNVNKTLLLLQELKAIKRPLLCKCLRTSKKTVKSADVSSLSPFFKTNSLWNSIW